MTLQRTVCLVPDETFPEIPANSLRLLPSTGDFCICADEVLLSPLPYHPQIVLIGIVAPICLSPFAGASPSRPLLLLSVYILTDQCAKLLRRIYVCHAYL